MSLYGLCKKEFIGKHERLVYTVIFYFPIIAPLFLLIPFVGIGYGLLFYINFIGDKKFVIYSDNRIRIEQPYIRFLGPNPRPIIYVKQNLTSFQDTVITSGYDENKDTLEVKKISDSIYIITHRSSDNWQVPTGIESFQYKLRH